MPTSKNEQALINKVKELENQLRFYNSGKADSIGPLDKRYAIWLEQLQEQGFDSTELWSLNTTFSRFVVPQLKQLKEKTGFPAQVKSHKKWCKIIDEIIFSFEFAQSERKFVVDNIRTWPKVEKGIHLFAKYYFNLL